MKKSVYTVYSKSAAATVWLPILLLWSCTCLWSSWSFVLTSRTPPPRFLWRVVREGDSSSSSNNNNNNNNNEDCGDAFVSRIRNKGTTLCVLRESSDMDMNTNTDASNNGREKKSTVSATTTTVQLPSPDNDSGRRKNDPRRPSSSSNHHPNHNNGPNKKNSSYLGNNRLTINSNSNSNNITTASSVSRHHHRHQNQHAHGKKAHPNNYNKNHYFNKRGKIKTMFRQARDMERVGRWRKSVEILRRILEMDPTDSYSHLALARLESRREHKNRLTVVGRTTNSYGNGTSNNNNNNQFARLAFLEGTTRCPDSIHLWQAWALYELDLGNRERAIELFEKALELDDCNPYVCHAYGLMQQRGGNFTHARELWERALTQHSTAALICSLGELLASFVKDKEMARELYARHVLLLHSERERTEVYLAAAWLEERHFQNVERAEDLIQRALKLSPSNGRAHVALVRLEERRMKIMEDASSSSSSSSTNSSSTNITARDTAAIQNNTHDNMRQRLAQICTGSQLEDGRLFNLWASLEVKSGHLSTAMDILQRAMHKFPRDQSLVQAAGKVAERLGQFDRARHFYSASLHIQPSAPALVAFALLELRHPTSSSSDANTTAATIRNSKNHTDMVRQLFEEALLIDPRHGPAYNAYGNMELRLNNIKASRQIFQRGVQRNCTDPASVYHGYAKLEISVGNVDKARIILMDGLDLVERQEGVRFENTQRERAVFLAHTLGMLELNSHNVMQARSVFHKGICKHKHNSQLLLGAALCEIRLGKETEARSLFEQAVHADHKHAHAWQAWGVMEMRAGNYTTAKTLLECGLKSVPTHGALWQAYATMESRIGNYDTARTLYAAGITKCPNHVPLYQAWACLELRGGYFNQAKRLIGEALTRDKRQGSGWLVAAKIEEKLGNHGLAMLLLRRGLQYAPNHAELYCALAQHEVEKGRIIMARSLLEKGLEVDPMHAPLYHSLAELEAKVFNIDGLAKLNKRAEKIFNNNALVPPPASSQAWSTKLQYRSTKLPKSVQALAEEVGVDGSGRRYVDAMSLIDSMAMFEDGILGDMLLTENTNANASEEQDS